MRFQKAYGNIPNQIILTLVSQSLQDGGTEGGFPSLCSVSSCGNRAFL